MTAKMVWMNSEMAESPDSAHVRAQQLIVWLTDAGFPYGASDVYTDQDDALRLRSR
jgi:hypothetical protein